MSMFKEQIKKYRAPGHTCAKALLLLLPIVSAAPVSAQDEADDAISPVISANVPDTLVSGSQFIGGNVSDEGGSGVASLTVFVNGSDGQIPPIVVVSPPKWAVELALDAGRYELNVVATDGAGNKSPSLMIPFLVSDVDQPVIGGIGEDGYDEIAECTVNMTDTVLQRTPVAPNSTPTFENNFDSTLVDIHEQLEENWSSAHVWRRETTDIIINNDGQFYLDVLGFDADLRNEWTPFEQLLDADEQNGYLAINAAKTSRLASGPIVNGEEFAGQDYLSGVLTTFGKHSIAPAANEKVVVELRARMPRGQGSFPATWLFNENFFTDNLEIDIFEYVGQSPAPDSDGWLRPKSELSDGEGEEALDSIVCGTACVNAGRPFYDTYQTQYHNYFTTVDDGGLASIGNRSVTNDGANTGAIYTNPEANTWWRGDTWAGCEIDFSDKFHIYTIEWSADEIAYYIDDVLVLRVDEAADSGGNLPGANFVPVSNQPSYLIMSFALGSLDNYIGKPDEFTEDAMAADELKLIVDYIKVWQ
ncbi:family 16 glycosylhydrolase [bacterium]|nr:family 16 glycosylhydrolase [bacterium]